MRLLKHERARDSGLGSGFGGDGSGGGCGRGWAGRVDSACRLDALHVGDPLTMPDDLVVETVESTVESLLDTVEPAVHVSPQRQHEGAHEGHDRQNRRFHA